MPGMTSLRLWDALLVPIRVQADLGSFKPLNPRINEENASAATKMAYLLKGRLFVAATEDYGAEPPIDINEDY